MTENIKDKPILPFHFLFMAIGEVLKTDSYINAQSLQNFVAKEEAFGGFRIPMDDCRMALKLMEDSGFIIEIPESSGNYQRDRHLIE